MDTIWKSEEALLAAREGVYLTPAQQARMDLDLSRGGAASDLRRALAAALIAAARKLDPDILGRRGRPARA